LDYSRKVIFSILAVALLGSATLAYAHEFSFSFVGSGADGGGTNFVTPVAIATDPNNRIITADNDIASKVQIYDSAGNFVLTFDGSDGNGFAFQNIPDIAVNSTNFIFVADLTADRIQIYDSTGTFISVMTGANGTGTAFDTIGGLAIDSNDRVIVSDTTANTIQIYDQGGFFLSTFTGSGAGGTNFVTADNIATDSNNRIIVADRGVTPDTVQIFDSTGTSFVTTFDGTTGGGTQFTSIIGVATDSSDRILVADADLDTVQIFDSTGSFVDSIDGADGGGTAFTGLVGVAVDTNDRVITIDETLLTVQVYVGSVPATTKSSGGSDQQWKTKPTFGLDHNSFRPLVDGGFSFNGVSHDITDNWWTPFAEQKVKIGSINSFTAKAYADKQLRVQEFLFGIPEVGDAHKAELGVEVVYDYSGEIDRINVVQKTDIIDIDSIKVIHSKSKCQSDDTVERCDTTRLSMKFLEPLQDKIMAIKGVDFKGRVHITYLNEGFDISGNSLNPMNTMMIPSTEKHEGLVEVTQTAKYSSIWTTQDGREFEMNTSGSFAQINQSFERHIDTGVIKNRLHSEFYTLKQSQADLASSIMPAYYRTSINYEDPFSEINDIFAYEFPDTFESKLDSPEIQNNMIIQAEKAQKIMEYLLDPKSYHK